MKFWVLNDARLSITVRCVTTMHVCPILQTLPTLNKAKFPSVVEPWTWQPKLDIFFFAPEMYLPKMTSYQGSYTSHTRSYEKTLVCANVRLNLKFTPTPIGRSAWKSILFIMQTIANLCLIR